VRKCSVCVSYVLLTYLILIGELLVRTTIQAFPGIQSHSTQVESFREYVFDTIKTRVKPPMHVLLPTLVYLSRAKPLIHYSKFSLEWLFCGALVIAAKVNSPPILEEYHGLNVFLAEYQLTSRPQRGVGSIAQL
jgi:hypothetical protein